MGAPMTEFLFLFLLGIASWSRCVTANTFTAISCSIDVVDGNNELESANCEDDGETFILYFHVKADYQGAVQFQMELTKDGEVVNTAGKSMSKPSAELGNICSTVESPETDDSCSMCEGEYTASGCSAEEMAKDLDIGEYLAKVTLLTDNGSFCTLTLAFNIES